MSQGGQGTDSNAGTDSGQDGDQQDQNGTGTDGAQGTGNGDGSGADSGQQNSDNDTGNDTVTRAEFERMQRQLSAADKKREEAEQKLKSIEEADLSELEKTKNSLEEVTTERDKLKDEVQNLRLHNAFLGANTITWQNGEVALGIAESKGYLEDVVGDDGTVDTKKMGVALKKLAEDHKYLVKTGDDGSDDGKGGQGGSHGPSGQSSSGNSKNANDDKAKAERLKKTLPALGRR